MRIRPPRSPEPSASGASKWAGVDDGRLPSLSQMQKFMAATILEGGCREASGRIHMNSATGLSAASLDNGSRDKLLHL